MKRIKEIRNFQLNITADEGRTAHIRIPYNQKSEWMGFYEILDPNVFKKTLQENNSIRVLVEHDDRLLIARSDNGSLRITNTPDALEADFDIPETTVGNDLLVEIKSGLILGASFGFIVVRDDYKFVDGDEVRTIYEAKLLELSCVRSIPAYSGTTVSVRSLSSAFEGKEVDEAGQTAIREEIEKLQNLLPKVEEKKEEEQKEPESEPQKEPEGPTEEEIKAQEEQKQKDIEEQEAIDSLYKRLEEAEKILCEA